MDHAVIDRRRDARFDRALLTGMRVTLRPGCAVSLVNLSAAGALVEAPRPLRPGACVHLQIVTLRRTFAVAAHILRCSVWAVDPDSGVLYRGALRFEHPCDMFRELPTPEGSALPAHENAGPPRGGNWLPGGPVAQRPPSRGTAK